MSGCDLIRSVPPKGRILRGWSRALLLVLVGGLSLGGLVPTAGAESLDGASWEHDLAKAYAESQENQQPMVLFVSMRGCHYCEKMIQETLTDPGVKEELAGAFVAAEVKQDKYASWVSQAGITSYPTTLIVNSEGKIMERIRGFVTARTLREKLATARRIKPRTSLLQ